MKLIVMFTVIFCWIILAFPLSATTIWVDDDNVTGPWDGSEANPYPFIQDGLDFALAGDTVMVKDGLYTGEGNKNLEYYGKAITLRSENGPDSCIIDCENISYPFFFHVSEGNDPVLDGFTITNSEYKGIYCYYSSPTISSCIVTVNLEEGIYCEESDPIISNCTITENTNQGIYCYYSNPEISDSRIYGNIGQGIYCDQSDSIIIGCNVYGNSGAGVIRGFLMTDCVVYGNSGNGISKVSYVSNCTVYGNSKNGINNCSTVSDCIVYENLQYGISEGYLISNCDVYRNLWSGISESYVVEGCEIYENFQSGVASTSSNTFIINCIITKNIHSGISTDTINTEITNCTISENLRYGISYSENRGLLRNSILWGNSEGQIEVIGDPLMNVEYCCVQDEDPDDDVVFPGTGNIDDDPLFLSPEWNNYHITSESPCIDTGTSTGAPIIDVDVEDRPSPAFGDYDIGADEYTDSDGDGLQDWWEKRYFGTATAADPAMDEEPDSLTNLDEYRYRTNPIIADTDGDGRNDGEEIADGTNPLYPDNAEKIYYVNDSTGNDMYDGLSASFDGIHGPKQTIQSGIDVAGSGWSYTVLVSDGTYTGDGNRDLDFSRKALTVQSENGPDVTIIDSEGSDGDYHRGFYFYWGEGPDSIVDGFTIRNGYYSGGGIFLDNSSPTITNCTITDNSSGSHGNGAGIYCHEDSNPMITNCTITGNLGYYGGGIFSRDNSPTIINCTISGNSGSNSGGGIACIRSNSIIADCTITDNWGNNGGGIYCWENGNPTITNCIITDNLDINNVGGGIYCYESSPTIADCTISGNSSKKGGGGIYCDEYSSPTITDCTITGNSSNLYGGGIHCDESRPIIINSTISENSAVNDGGGIFCTDASHLTITNCTITGNSADNDGGGIYCYESSPKITNCTLAGNSAGDDGGGIYCYTDSNLVIINCTITGNSAVLNGGGICCSEYNSLTVINSILWDDSPDEIYVSSGTPTVTYSDIQGGTGKPWFGEGCIDANPRFAVDGYWDGDMWVEGDYHLTAVSPCIDAGTNDASELPMFDLDGNLRIWIGRISYRVDMGAYEYGSKTVGISNIRVLGTVYVELTWLCSDEGVTEFDVWYSDEELSATMMWNLLEGDVPSGGVETMYVDTTASSAGMRYYKVSY